MNNNLKAGVDVHSKSNTILQHDQKQKTIPSAVLLDHNLTIKTAWIHCRASVSVTDGCCAIFKNLHQLLRHEREAHGWRGGSAKVCEQEMGTYKLVRPPCLKVTLCRSEVEGKLQEQTGQRILRRRARMRPRPSPSADSSDSEDSDFRQDDDLDSLHSSDKDSVGDAEFDLTETSTNPFDAFECLKCRAQFSSQHSLNIHLKKLRCFKSRTVSRPFKCPHCYYHFGHPRTVQAHVKSVHLELMSYSCEICGIKFSTLCKLQEHKFSLHRVKSFLCTFAPTVCKKRFGRASQLKRHINHVHLNLPRKHKQQPPSRGNWFTCDKCPQRCRTEEGLKKHFRTCLMRMHEPELEPIVESVHSQNAEDLEEPEQDPLAVHTDKTPPLATEARKSKTGVDIKKEPGTRFADSEDPVPSTADEHGDFKFVLHEVGDIDIKEEGRFINASASAPKSSDAGEMEGRGILGAPQLTPTTTTALAEHANGTLNGSGQVIITSAQNQSASQDEESAATQVKLPAPGCLTCPVCVKNFATRKSLRYHIDRHNGKLVCKCEVCGKRFGSSCNLKLHMLTHTNETPYKCSHCGVGFKTIHGRTHHERKEHTGDLPFACQYCDKKFVCRQYCKVHELRAHTREKNYNCSYCDKKFIMKRHVVEHERRHTGEKPLLCTYCGRGFARDGDRRDHHKRHQAMIEKMRALGMADEVTEMADKSTSLKKA